MTGTSTVLSVSPVQYNAGTASQSGVTVTGAGTAWTSAMVGSQLIYANGISAGTITAFGGATSLTVTTSQTVASQAYTINYTGLQVSSSGNVGIGNLSPAALLDIGSSGSMLGTIQLEGGTSGYVQIQPAAVAGSWTMILPSSVGTSGQVLQTDGTGVTSWVTPSGSGLSWQSEQTSNFNATAGNAYPCNTSGGAFTATLPASATTGQQILFVDDRGTFAANPLTLNSNGLAIQGIVGPSTVNGNRQAVTLTYINSTEGWCPTASANQGATAVVSGYTAIYLLVAGGGGASNSGGGGAGGYLTGSTNLSPGTTYSVIVGGGGAHNVAGSGTGTAGSNTTGLSLTAVGGGGGAGFSSPASSGGSGGGGGSQSGNTSAGAGTTGQGYAGGVGYVNNSYYAGGGGGGAGAIGGSAVSGTAGGGGVGLKFTTNNTYYAGGGGAGGGAVTAGGNGGGGAGGGQGGAGTAGTANTGGGGGGSTTNGSAANGGSGVVILVVPTLYYSGTTTGSPSVTTSGSNTIMQFTSSGSYTA